MIAPEQLFPTHSAIAVALEGQGIFKKPTDKNPVEFLIRVALHGTETMLVKVPWNQDTVPMLKLLKETIMSNPGFVCGVEFDNLHIRFFQYTDPVTHQISSGYTATATGIKRIYP